MRWGWCCGKDRGWPGWRCVQTSEARSGFSAWSKEHRKTPRVLSPEVEGVGGGMATFSLPCSIFGFIGCGQKWPSGHWIILMLSFCLSSFYNPSQISSVQSLSPVRLCNPMNCSMPGLPFHTNSRSSLKLMSIESVMPSSHLILCCPLLFLPPIPPSIRVFSNDSTPRMRWPKCWSFSPSISASNEHPGLVSSSMDWLDLRVVQETLKSLLQHHSSKASIFGAQLSSRSNSHIHTWPLEKP